MFTGIVEEIGRVERFDGGRLRIAAHTVLQEQDGAAVKLGDSIAVSGCCLTLVAQGDGWWEADVSEETLARTSLRTPSGVSSRKGRTGISRTPVKMPCPASFSTAASRAEDGCLEYSYAVDVADPGLIPALRAAGTQPAQALRRG